jgi:hypothetical protein
MVEESIDANENMSLIEVCAFIESGQIETEILVPVALTPVTADFSSVPPALSFSESMNVSCIEVQINDDELFEDDETFRVNLDCGDNDGVVKCGLLASTQITIVNNDGKILTYLRWTLSPVSV